ncbi:MAG: hypothetical protein Q7S40_11470 [Opitutaceae bacterium]|nr:hypothetical protein [Opitutaceae bacterium]
MKTPLLSTILVTLLAPTVSALLAAEQPPAARGSELSNSVYVVALKPDHTLQVTHRPSGTQRTFTGRFVILACDRDPHLTYVRASTVDVPEEERDTRSSAEAYVVPQWDRADGKGRTHDLFAAAAETVAVNPSAARAEPGRITWTYATSPRFQLTAAIEVPEGAAEPKISFVLKTLRDGWYSVGYAGAPELGVANVDTIYQSRIWQEKRFPRLAFLSTERMCSLPITLVTAGGITVGLAADPRDGPFRIPTFADSRFGLAVRNRGGQAQPQFFSPVLGNSTPQVLAMDQGLGRKLGDAKIKTSQPSRLKAGAQMASSFRLLVQPGDWYATFVHLARSLYEFADVRENVGGSLNRTLENMIAYALNDTHAGWVPEFKASDYTTDVPGTVKNVSALHPLSISLVTDSEDIFRRRALPITEYLLSREKYLFATDPEIKRQNPSAYLRGPAAEVSELSALFLMSQGRTFAFRHLAEANYGKPRARNLNIVTGASWQDALALFRMTGERSHLDRAVTGALAYIAARITKPQTNFDDVQAELGGQFWTDFTPKWTDLFELYEETRDKRILAAARAAAAQYASFATLYPVIPAGQNVRVNPGGRVGRYAYQSRLFEDPRKLIAPEQEVPAWQMAWNGLLPEAATTYGSNGAVFLAPHAAYFLRLAHHTGDAFFRDLGRAAVVGRYSNYPGYAINGEFTTVYARPDYPARPLPELTYNNIYYPHIWPQIAFLHDYLFSDLLARSGGKIEFPARYAQGYAYLQSKVYGDRPGRFYDDADVRLWMPAQLLEIDDVQVNHVTAIGSDRFYVALLNESGRPVRARVRINPLVLPLNPERRYRAREWRDNREVAAIEISGSGIFTVEIAPRGLTALAVDGVKVQTQFQQKFFAGERQPLGPRSYVEANPTWSPVKASVISFGDELAEAYIYLQATGRELQSVRLSLMAAPDAPPIEDRNYPFEFTLPWPTGTNELTVKLSATNIGGKVEEPLVLTLRRD